MTRLWLTGAALAAVLVSAQNSAAQEVVQPLPPTGSADLGAALQRLARDDKDLNALLDAGDAAIALGDISAAIGFYGRAQAISPGNARVSLGLAKAYTFARRPVEALQLFAQAERAGTPLALMAAERGLAFDLVGDSTSAQDLYRLALSQRVDDEVKRNLALSQAISGDRSAFEATLLPLLQKGDNAAFRTRAFGLAILGDTQAAIRIARDMMGASASRIEPYLRYMTRLTPAQQAAAGALGVFPSTSEIGQDETQIAGYLKPSGSSIAQADAPLAPAGPPLGRARASRANDKITAPAAPPVRVVVTQPIDAGEELPPLAEQPSIRPSAPTPMPSRQTALASVAEPVLPPANDPAPTAGQILPAPPPPPSMTEAFADLALPAVRRSAPQAGAVDITTIDIPRERDEPPPLPPPPPPPPAPSRHWVQLATGRDVAALGFDWRRITRNAQGYLSGTSGYTAAWGEANRLLAGPYPSATAARETVAKLKAIGIDSFAYTNPRGEQIVALDGAAPAPAAKSQPVHAARHWVQVATGRDEDALGFDWRRIARASQGALADKGPHIAKWGQTNRLLAGPYHTPAAARVVVTKLKSLGIDSFVFSSAAGEPVTALD